MRRIMESIFADIRYGLRSLLKRPAATLIALVTLALGIGVNTAIFGAVDSILLRPLPFKDPERIVSVWEQSPALGIQQNEAAPANFFDLRNQNQVFEALGAFGPFDINLTGSGEPERLTPKAFANFSPWFERSENPGYANRKYR